MVKKALMMLGVLAIVGVAGLSLLLPDAVNASGHSAARSFVTDSVAAGSELEVTLQVTGLGGFGQVRETLPDGFVLVRSEDVTASVDGQIVAFTILGSDATFHYTVTASTTPGTYEFSGTVGDSNRDSRAVAGASSVEVTGPKGPEASRSISRSSVDSGGQVTITITTLDYGAAGTVVETLPRASPTPPAPFPPLRSQIEAKALDSPSLATTASATPSTPPRKRATTPSPASSATLTDSPETSPVTTL